MLSDLILIKKTLIKENFFNEGFSIIIE